MENLIIMNRHDLCEVYGGKGIITEEKLARIIGRILGVAAKTIYDMLTGKIPAPTPPKVQPKPAG